ncbi:enoyl-CoA hydratase/isomerase family protein [Nannocystis punicea]|uniref:Enoyl-CoA hydratase/isomerase family protein n=1 Tax=Nannocystis punicea TaxID=2995304 RepID=A0ABY7HFX4_9BACT|nr:enoyl-CoA hydratase/isomerase family protein [Nannocystis poenicansa]WAS98203.1 enoyl-CoA hydratase/isomerase family protein [Nannocystis poenicansa]
MRVRCEEGELIHRLFLGAGPGGHVALDTEGIAALADAVELAAAGSARALVIASEGPEFCAGMDLAAALRTPAAQMRAAMERYAACLELLTSAKLATIAVVTGAASGGGVGLAAACDLVVAGPAAAFSLPELRYGLVPAVILPALEARIGARRTRRLALTGELVTAAQAEPWGLVDMVADDPNGALRGLLRSLLRARPQAVATLKRITGQAGQGGVAQTAADLEDPELRAALAALLADGQAPPWFARLKGQE